MNDDPASPVPPRRLGELSHLAALLTDRVLSARDAGQNMPEAHIHALLDAAILLDKYEAELPAALTRLVDQVDGARSEAEDGKANLA